jgi:NDP-sugar pyrophosphorylase family protein
MRGVILAAGFGTRLWPLTEDRTKPAIPFLNRPLISYSVQYLAEHGIHEIIINLHHQPESIREVLGNGSQYGAEIEYSYEKEILGTSGALDRVKDQLVDDDFVVMNGKIITAMNLAAAIRHHQDKRALATLVLRPNPARDRFSIVELGPNGWITEFGPHPKPVSPSIGLDQSVQDSRYGGPSVAAHSSSPPSFAGDAAPLMFTGIQVLSPRIFEYVPRGVFSHSTVHVYPRAIHAGEPVIGYVSDDDWYEMSTLDRYLEASMSLLGKALPLNGAGHLVTGRDCIIHAGAEVHHSVLWDRVEVEAGARVERSVIGDGVRIPSGSSIGRAAVVRRDRVSNIERGTVVGDNLIVPIV